VDNLYTFLYVLSFLRFVPPLPYFLSLLISEAFSTVETTLFIYEESAHQSFAFPSSIDLLFVHLVASVLLTFVQANLSSVVSLPIVPQHG